MLESYPRKLIGRLWLTHYFGCCYRSAGAYVSVGLKRAEIHGREWCVALTWGWHHA